MKKNIIQLSDHFTFKRLLRFTFPAIIMMVFTSLYTMVDGFFVSNFVGKTAFAAVNYIMPILLILGAVGLMFGTGGSALISKTLGEGKKQLASELFSMVIYTLIGFSLILAAAGILFLRPIAQIMGADGQLLEDSLIYGRIILAALPFNMLQYGFQCLFASAEKPHLGLYITVAAGMTNILLDALFVAGFHWGLAGAAIATAVSQFVGGVLPLLYFSKKNTSQLRLVKCHFNGRALRKICINGSSEFMGEMSSSLVSILYNLQLMAYVGEDGVAAYGVLMYVAYLFQSIFIGYSIGGAPIVGYHYGAGNHEELKNLRKKNLTIIAIFSLLMFFSGQVLAKPMSKGFVGYDSTLFDMTVHAFILFSFSFLMSGFSIYASSFFTALNDGVTSALIAFLRTFIFRCILVLLLPLLWGLDGIWLSAVFAEILALLVSFGFLVGKRKKYHY